MPVMTLPEGAPATLREAFAHIGTVTAPTVLDMKVMVLTEAAAMALYYTTAEGTDVAGIVDLLQANGRAEMLHAERVSAAIKAVSASAPQTPGAPASLDGWRWTRARHAFRHPGPFPLCRFWQSVRDCNRRTRRGNRPALCPSGPFLYVP